MITCDPNGISQQHPVPRRLSTVFKEADPKTRQSETLYTAATRKRCPTTSVSKGYPPKAMHRRSTGKERELPGYNMFEASRVWHGIAVKLEIHLLASILDWLDNRMDTTWYST